MGLINTTSVQTSIGSSMINTFCNVVFNTSSMLVDGKVYCSLNWYKTEADFDAGSDKVFPVEGGLKVEDAVIQLTMGDIVKLDGNCTMQDVVNFFFTKVADKLNADYSWTCSIS